MHRSRQQSLEAEWLGRSVTVRVKIRVRARARGWGFSLINNFVLFSWHGVDVL